MTLIKEYEDLFRQVTDNRVIDPSSYMEYYLYKLLNENKYLKESNGVKPNFKILNDAPISHASPGPDIEVYLKEIALICECSLKSGIKQFDDEHESVSRHYEEFKKTNIKKYPKILGFFISPLINKEISKWFYSLNKEIMVIPISLNNFITFMGKLSDKPLEEYEIELIKISEIINKSKNEEEWLKNISIFIEKEI